MNSVTEEVKVKDIPGYEGLYGVTEDGRIYAYPNVKRKGFWLSLERSTKYIRLALVDVNGSRKWYPLHRLVALTYLPNPLKKEQVNHKNCIKYDCRADNLEWVTWHENMYHAVQCGQIKGWTLPEEQQQEIYRKYSHGVRVSDLAGTYGTSDSSVYRYIRKWRTIH